MSSLAKRIQSSLFFLLSSLAKRQSSLAKRFIAFFADAFDDIVAARAREAFGKRDQGDGCVVKAIDLMAFLTIEMHVEVVIILFRSMTEAQFIAHATFTVFYRVYEMMVTEEHQGTEDAALVHAPQLFLQFGE